MLFRTNSGEPLVATFEDLNLEVTPPELRVSLAPATWPHVIGERLFWLDGAHAGEVAQFKPISSLPLQLTLQLDADGWSDLRAVAASTERDEVQLDARLWRLLKVEQMLDLPPELEGKGSVKVGARSLWPEGKPKGEEVSDEAEVDAAEDDGEQAPLPGRPMMPIVKRVLDQRDLAYKTLDDDALEATVDSPRGSWTVRIEAREDDGELIVWSRWGVEVPPNRLDAMMRFLTRANTRHATGAFELDLDSRRVSFRTSLALGFACDLEPGTCAQLFEINAPVFFAYLGPLQQVVDGADPDQLRVDLRDEDLSATSACRWGPGPG